MSLLRRFYALKSVYRFGSVGVGPKKRKESAAEHTWSAMILADYFLDILEKNSDRKTRPKLDRLKVYELLLYHDIVEIEAGDLSIHLEEERKNKKASEQAAMNKLIKELPQNMRPKILALFKEFESQNTVEARFARAVDRLDGQLHELDYPDDWKGWGEENLRRYLKNSNYDEFPEIKEMFEEFVVFARENGYFDE